MLTYYFHKYQLSKNAIKKNNMRRWRRRHSSRRHRPASDFWAARTGETIITGENHHWQTYVSHALAFYSGHLWFKKVWFSNTAPDPHPCIAGNKAQTNNLWYISLKLHSTEILFVLSCIVRHFILTASILIEIGAFWNRFKRQLKQFYWNV